MATMRELADSLPEHEREHVRELAENALFMRGKLEETRIGLSRQQVVIAYDNGGGQTGIRRNPAFDAYEALLKSYQLTLRELRDMLQHASDKSEDESPLANILAEAEAVLSGAG